MDEDDKAFLEKKKAGTSCFEPSTSSTTANSLAKPPAPFSERRLTLY